MRAFAVRELSAERCGRNLRVANQGSPRRFLFKERRVTTRADDERSSTVAWGPLDIRIFVWRTISENIG